MTVKEITSEVLSFTVLLDFYPDVRRVETFPFLKTPSLVEEPVTTRFFLVDEGSSPRFWLSSSVFGVPWTQKEEVQGNDCLLNKRLV